MPNLDIWAALERKLAKEMEYALFAAIAGPAQRPRQTALRTRGRSFEVVELDDDGKVIEPIRCICGGLIVIHRPECPFYYLNT